MRRRGTAIPSQQGSDGSGAKTRKETGRSRDGDRGRGQRMGIRRLHEKVQGRALSCHRGQEGGWEPGPVLWEGGEAGSPSWALGDVLPAPQVLGPLSVGTVLGVACNRHPHITQPGNVVQDLEAQPFASILPATQHPEEIRSTLVGGSLSSLS